MEGSGARMVRFSLIVSVIIGFTWLYALQLVNPESQVTRFIQENFLGKELKPLADKPPDSLVVSTQESKTKKKDVYRYTPSDDYRDYYSRRKDRPLPRTVKNTPPVTTKSKSVKKLKQPTEVVKLPVVSVPVNIVPLEKTNLTEQPGTISIRSGRNVGDRLLAAGEQGIDVFRFSLLANNQAVLVSEIHLENDLNNDEKADKNHFDDSYNFGLYTMSGKSLGIGQMPGDGTVVFRLSSPLRVPAESSTDLVIKVDVLPINSMAQRLKEVRLSINRNAANNGIKAQEERSGSTVASIAGDGVGARVLNTKGTLRVRNLGVSGSVEQAIAKFSLSADAQPVFVRRVSWAIDSSAGSFDGVTMPAQKLLAVHSSSSGAKFLATIERIKGGQYGVNFIQPVLRLKPYETKTFEIRYMGNLSNKSAINSTLMTDSKLFTNTTARNRANIVWSDIKSSADYYLSGYLLRVD